MNDHTPLTTLVLLDPTNADGEAALESLDSEDRHIALVVLLSGRTSAALREFAAAEGISLADAGFTYLDQVAHRAAAGSRLVETVLATGPDATAELVLLANERHVGRIVLPPSIMRGDAAATDRLAAALPGVAVSVAGLVGTR